MLHLTKFARNLKQSFFKLPLTTKILVFFSLTVGSVIRVLGGLSLGYYFDMVYTQYTWGKLAVQMGLFGFWADYPMNKHFDYPPLSLIYEYFLALLSAPFNFNIQLFIFLLKGVNWLVEILFILVFAYLMKRFSGFKPSTTWLISSLIYILPSLWFVSAIWGQNDTLVVLISFLTVFILFYKRGFKPVSATENVVHKVWYKDLAFWSGVLWAVGIWIKQQPVLVLPLILLFFIYGKTWKNLFQAVCWILPFIVLLGLAGNMYSGTEYFLNNPFQIFLTPLGINWPTFSSWNFIRNIGVFVLVFSLITTLVFRNLKDNWQEARYWFLGALLTTNIISIPFVISNYQRYARVTFAATSRNDVIANGATTFWGLFDFLRTSNDWVAKIGSFELKVSLAGNLIYLALILVILSLFLGLNWSKVKTLNLSKIFARPLTFADFNFIMWLNVTAYFLFFTKMHSRYLHFGILFAFLVLPFLYTKQTVLKLNQKLLILGWFVFSVLLQFSYFLNQILVYGSNNPYPTWVPTMIANFDDKHWNINAWWWASLLNSIFFFGLYGCMIWYYWGKRKELFKI